MPLKKPPFVAVPSIRGSALTIVFKGDFEGLRGIAYMASGRLHEVPAERHDHAGDCERPPAASGLPFLQEHHPKSIRDLLFFEDVVSKPLIEAQIPLALVAGEQLEPLRAGEARFDFLHQLDADSPALMIGGELKVSGTFSGGGRAEAAVTSHTAGKRSGSRLNC